jgi:hypothetical protein
MTTNEQGENQLTAEDCQRVERGEEQPKSYDIDACQECKNWNCRFMPEGAEEKFNDEERDSMFPNGEDDE